MNKVYTIANLAVLLILIGGTYLHAEQSSYALGNYDVCNKTTEVNVLSKAYFVKDTTTGNILLEKNADAQLPLASLTKLMTAYVANKELEEGDIVAIPQNALEPEGDSGLLADELWNVEDLTDFTLMTSSNDGAHALALLSDGNTETFIKKMNDTAKEAGLNQTFFLSDTGLDVSTTTAGAYGSARDIANLMDYISKTKTDLFDGSTQLSNVFHSVSGFRHDAEHTSTIPRSIPAGLIIKTGFTDLAGGNLAVLSELVPGRQVAIVVLGSTLEERESDVLLLADAAKRQLKKESLCKPL